MKKFLLVLAAIAGTFALVSTEASAQQRVPVPTTDVRVGGGGVPGVGVWVGSSTLCTAGTLIVTATIVGNTQGRELSQEEAATALVTCFLPPAWLIACNSEWRYNNSLPPQTVRNRRVRQPDPRHRENVFCAGLPPVVAPVVVRAAY